MTYQSTARKCATCEHWGGPRELSPSRNFVEVDPLAKGVCTGHINNSHLQGSHVCTRWEKWKALPG